MPLIWPQISPLLCERSDGGRNGGGDRAGARAVGKHQGERDARAHNEPRQGRDCDNPDARRTLSSYTGLRFRGPCTGVRRSRRYRFPVDRGLYLSGQRSIRPKWRRSAWRDRSQADHTPLQSSCKAASSILSPWSRSNKHAYRIHRALRPARRQVKRVQPTCLERKKGMIGLL